MGTRAGSGYYQLFDTVGVEEDGWTGWPAGSGPLWSPWGHG